MMRKNFYRVIGFITILFLSGCFNYDEEAEELVEYYNGWLKIRGEEPKLGVFIDIGTEEDEEKIKRLLSENVMPVFRESVEYLENAELDHKHIQQLNQLLIDEEKYILEMCQELSDILREGTKAEFDKALNKSNEHENELLEKKADKVHEKREELMDKYEIYWIIDYDEYGNELELLGRDR
ncbi:hypothetical protein ACW2QC_03650 [Virgibacillus sp. FSP13]